MCYTQQEQPGEMSRYEALDPATRHRVRMTLVRQKHEARYAPLMNQHCESLHAGDVPLAKSVEVPERISDFFAWDVPKKALKDYVLTLRIETTPDAAAGDRASVEQWRNCGSRGTIVGEVWLMRK